MTVSEHNLDMVAAEVGFKLAETFKSKNDAEKLENLITKSLGILIEDGLFACAVWLESRSDKEKEYATEISNKCMELLKDERIKLARNETASLREITLSISDSIQKTLLGRQLLERMLIYARYRAKALQKGETE